MNEYWAITGSVIAMVVGGLMTLFIIYLNWLNKKWGEICNKQSKMIRELMSDWIKAENKSLNIPYAKPIKDDTDGKWRPTAIEPFWYKKDVYGKVIVSTLSELEQDSKNDWIRRARERFKEDQGKAGPFTETGPGREEHS